MSREEQVRNILPAPSLQTDSFAHGTWPEKAWWTQYGSTELNHLIETALVQNPSIQAIRERIEYAKNQAIISRADLFPLIYFNASDQWEYISQNGLYRALNPNIALNNQQIDFSLSFSYEFDFWGKYRNMYEAALGRQRAAIAESAQVELIISTALAQTYFALQTNLARKTYYEQLLQIRQKYFALQNKMLQSALYSKLVPLLSQELVFQAEQWLDQINQEIAINQHTINILAGRGPDEPLNLTEPLARLPEQLAIPDNISSELLSRRPDLAAQLWRMDALAHEVGAAKAEFYPDINLLGIAGFQSGSWSTLWEWISRTIGLTPGLSLPVYTAGAIGANVDAKRALFNEAVYQYNDLLLKSFQQVADILSIGKAIYHEKLKQTQIVFNAAKRTQLTLHRQKSGIDSALTSYKQEEEEIQKKLEDIQLLYQQYLVSVNLTKALGGGYTYE